MITSAGIGARIFADVSENPSAADIDAGIAGARAGDPVDAVLHDMTSNPKANDIVIDGGNSKFTDSMRRAKELAQKVRGA